MDSRSNSSAYSKRLHKYAQRRGFSVVVPGFNAELVAQQLAMASYVFVEDHELLLRINALGRPEAKELTIEFAERKACIRYERCDEASVVDGLAKLVVMHRRENVRTVRLPKARTCPKCTMLTVESGPPLLLYSGVPKLYHLLWGATVPEDEGVVHSDTPGEEDSCEYEDLSGYTCTPLARAYDLFSNLLDQHAMEDPATGHVKSGVAARLSARIAQQNGAVAAAACRRHYDRALSSNRRVRFVWDLVSAGARFESLACIIDASKVPTLAAVSGDDRAFQRRYGLPKLLEFTAASPREPSEIDWFHGVY